MSGRPVGSGKPSISREQTTEAHALLHHGRRWPLIRLRQLIFSFKREQATAQRSVLLDEQRACRSMLRKKLEPRQRLHWQRTAAKCGEALREIEGVLAALKQGDEKAWRLADNFLSGRKRQWERIATEKRYVQLDEIDALWHAWIAQCERAMLNGDAKWFRSQADAIEKGDERTDAERDRDRFQAEVLRRVTFSKNEHPPRNILGSFDQRKDTTPLTDKEKRQILEHEQQYKHAVVEDLIGKSYTRNKDGELIAVSKGGGALIVEWTLGKRSYGCRFKNKRCARRAIRDIVKQIQEAHRFS